MLNYVLYRKTRPAFLELRGNQQVNLSGLDSFSCHLVVDDLQLWLRRMMRHSRRVLIPWTILQVYRSADLTSGIWLRVPVRLVFVLGMREQRLRMCVRMVVVVVEVGLRGGGGGRRRVFRLVVLVKRGRSRWYRRRRWCRCAAAAFCVAVRVRFSWTARCVASYKQKKKIKENCQLANMFYE